MLTIRLFLHRLFHFRSYKKKVSTFLIGARCSNRTPTIKFCSYCNWWFLRSSSDCDERVYEVSNND